MNWTALFALLPLPALIGWALAVPIPYLSALATRHPGHLTGIVTAALALVDGLLVELAAQAPGHYNVGAAAGQAFLVWLTATKWHSKVLAGTQTEANLYMWPHLPAVPNQQKQAA